MSLHCNSENLIFMQDSVRTEAEIQPNHSLASIHANSNENTHDNVTYDRDMNDYNATDFTTEVNQYHNENYLHLKGSVIGEPGNSNCLSNQQNPNVNLFNSQREDGVNEQEFTVCEQARVLLNLFIRHKAKNTPVEPAILELCYVNQYTISNCGLSEDYFNQVVTQLLRIADEISKNEKIEKFIEMVPIHSTKEIFFKVCCKVFEDEKVNWGRIVTLFYFASRLIIRNLTEQVGSLLWAKHMLSWAVDYFKLHFAKWILSKGGWAAIQKWVKFSEKFWMMLFFGSCIFGLWAYFKKS